MTPRFEQGIQILDPGDPLAQQVRGWLPHFSGIQGEPNGGLLSEAGLAFGIASLNREPSIPLVIVMPRDLREQSRIKMSTNPRRDGVFVDHVVINVVMGRGWSEEIKLHQQPPALCYLGVTDPRFISYQAYSVPDAWGKTNYRLMAALQGNEEVFGITYGIPEVLVMLTGCSAFFDVKPEIIFGGFAVLAEPASAARA